MIPAEDTTEIYDGQSGQIPKLHTTSDFLPYSSFFPHHPNTINLKNPFMKTFTSCFLLLWHHVCVCVCVCVCGEAEGQIYFEN
jgi:hypothetical protein